MAEYIKREDAEEVVTHFMHSGGFSVADFIYAFGKIPVADVVERKKGKWIWDDEGYHCSECWFHAHGNTLECMDGTYRFCPNCGAEMVGE